MTGQSQHDARFGMELEKYTDRAKGFLQSAQTMRCGAVISG
jgi:hypothetical protein